MKNHRTGIKSGSGAVLRFILPALVVIFCTQSGMAAIEKHFSGLDKQNQYIDKGIFVGGEAGTTHTLLAVRRHFSAKDKLERIVFDLGDEKGEPLRGRVSFHQVVLDPKKALLVVDLAQMKSSAVSEDALRQVFSKSPFVKSTKMTFDPTDGGMTIALELKRQAKMEVFRLPSPDKSGRLVLDLKIK